MLTARDVMTDRVVTIGPDAYLQEAIEVLLARQHSGLPVVDDNGRTVAVVALEDLVEEFVGTVRDETHRV